jgi:hypothetical protein
LDLTSRTTPSTRLKQLEEEENAKLKRLLAGAMLDNAGLTLPHLP